MRTSPSREEGIEQCIDDFINNNDNDTTTTLSQDMMMKHPKNPELNSNNEIKKWRTIVEDTEDASNSSSTNCIEVVKNMSIDDSYHHKSTEDNHNNNNNNNNNNQYDDTNPTEQTTTITNEEIHGNEIVADDSTPASFDEFFIDFQHDIAAIEAIIGISESASTTGFSDDDDNDNQSQKPRRRRRRRRRGPAELQLVTKKQHEQHDEQDQEERGPTDDEEEKRDTTNQERDNNNADHFINDCNNCMEGMQWNLICTHCHNESFRIEAVSNLEEERNQQQKDGGNNDIHLVSSSSNTSTKLRITNTTAESTRNVTTDLSLRNQTLLGLEHGAVITQDDLREMLQKNVVSALEATREMTHPGNSNNNNSNNKKTLLALKEKMRELDSIINRILQDEPEVVNEDDGMEDEINALKYSEEMMRQEMEAIDIVMSTTGSSLRSVPSSQDQQCQQQPKDQKEANEENIADNQDKNVAPSISPPITSTVQLETPEYIPGVTDCCFNNNGEMAETPPKGYDLIDNTCNGANDFLSCPFVVIDENEHGNYNDGGVEEHKDDSNNDHSGAHGTEAMLIPEHRRNSSPKGKSIPPHGERTDEDKVPVKVPSHNESESYLFDFAENAQAESPNNNPAERTPAEDMSPLEYELQFTQTESLISNITISDGMLGSSSRETSDSNMEKIPVDQGTAPEMNRLTPNMAAPIELITFNSEDFLDGMANDLALLEQELREACDGSLSDTSGIVTLDFPHEQPLTPKLMLSDSSEEESSIIPAPKEPEVTLEADRSEQHDVGSDGLCDTKKGNLNNENHPRFSSSDMALASCVKQTSLDSKTSTDGQIVTIAVTSAAESSSTLENHPSALEISGTEALEIIPNRMKEEWLHQASHEATDDSIECQLLHDVEA